MEEPEIVDLAIAAYACDTTGTVTLAALLPQGKAFGTRTGKGAYLDCLSIEGVISAGAAGVVTKARLLVVRDSQGAGALPTILDVLQTATSNSQYNSDNLERYEILLDRNWVLLGAAGATSESAFAIEELVQVTDMIWYTKTDTTGVIADIEKGAVSVITIGDVAAGAAAGVATFGVRAYFER